MVPARYACLTTDSIRILSYADFASKRTQWSGCLAVKWEYWMTSVRRRAARAYKQIFDSLSNWFNLNRKYITYKKSVLHVSTLLYTICHHLVSYILQVIFYKLYSTRYILQAIFYKFYYTSYILKAIFHKLYSTRYIPIIHYMSACLSFTTS